MYSKSQSVSYVHIYSCNASNLQQAGWGEDRRILGRSHHMEHEIFVLGAKVYDEWTI